MIAAELLFVSSRQAAMSHELLFLTITLAFFQNLQCDEAIGRIAYGARTTVPVRPTEFIDCNQTEPYPRIPTHAMKEGFSPIASFGREVEWLPDQFALDGKN